MSRLRFLPVVIANGASLSAEADIGDSEILVGIILPTITSAAITLQSAPRDPDLTSGTFSNVFTSAGEYTPSAAGTGGQLVLIDSEFQGIGPFVKVRSGTAAAAVNQGAERTITLVTRNT